MKKKIFGFLSLGLTAVLTAVLICGCSGLNTALSRSPSGVDKLYTAQCEITVDGEDGEELLTYGGILTRLGGGMWELDLDSPDTVKGLKIKLGENGINASLGDLNLNLETDKIPSKAAFLNVFSALDNAAANINSMDFSETETNLCYHGTCGGEKYTLLCDKVNNFPCGLNIGKINVIIVNFTVTGSEQPTVTGTSESSSETTTAPAETTAETTAPTETETTTETQTETVSVTLETTSATTSVQTMPSITFTSAETTETSEETTEE